MIWRLPRPTNAFEPPLPEREEKTQHSADVEEALQQFQDKFMEFRADYKPHFLEYKSSDETAAEEAKVWLRTTLIKVKEAAIQEERDRVREIVEGMIEPCSCKKKGQRVCTCSEYEAGKEAAQRDILAALQITEEESQKIRAAKSKVE